MQDLFNHPDLHSYINIDKYNNFINNNEKSHQFFIFCSRCYKLSGYDISYDSEGGSMSYEDQIIHLLIMKYYFEATKM